MAARGAPEVLRVYRGLGLLSSSAPLRVAFNPEMTFEVSFLDYTLDLHSAGGDGTAGWDGIAVEVKEEAGDWITGGRRDAAG